MPDRFLKFPQGRLQHLLDNKNWTAGDLAQRLPVTPAAVRNWLHGGQPYRKRLPDLLRLFDCESEQDLYGERNAKLIYSQTVIDKNLLSGTKQRQDHKNIIGVPEVSKRLLQGNRCPSLATCIDASRCYFPADISYKDRPYLEGFTYNHFFQPSIVFTLPGVQDGHPEVIGYDRRPLRAIPAHIHTQGLSILWAASYYYNLSRMPDPSFDEWMTRASFDKTKAERELVEGSDALLLKMVAHKIKIRPATLAGIRIVPFGVVTNDQRSRSPKCHRVYSQYVFRAHLEPTCDVDAFMATIWAPGVELCRLSPKLKPADCFCDKEGNKNRMDILVWSTLYSNQARCTDGRAKFTRGFAVV